MKKSFSLKIEDKWTISDWESIANGKVRISFSSATKKSVLRSRKILEDKITNGDCGCKKRKDKLNNMFPYGRSNE